MGLGHDDVRRPGAVRQDGGQHTRHRSQPPRRPRRRPRDPRSKWLPRLGRTAGHRLNVIRYNVDLADLTAPLAGGW
jgi:hypothetical protein